MFKVNNKDTRATTAQKMKFSIKDFLTKSTVPDVNGGVLVAYFIPFCNVFIVGF